jgi:glycine cleavage system transcriptional repressor
MRSFALAVTGRDRPGIVAAVTRVLLDHGVNLEDAEMAILRGHFAFVLVLGAPDGVDEDALRGDLDAVRRAVPLESVSLSEVEALERRSPPPTHAVSVYGADRPGIVYDVTHALASRGVNVVGMSSRLAGEEPIYAMLLEVALPPTLGDAELDELLARLRADLGVDLSARAVDGDVL